MVYGSVCSGIEAATVAWEPLGWKPMWFSEIEKFPSAVLDYHYPSVPNLGDMTQIYDKPEFQSTHIDLLVGGTPCQSFSIAGKRLGLDDPRGILSLEFMRIAQIKRPQWIVWENVPGVLSHDKGRTFGTIIGTLAKLGYGFAYRVLDARYFGVPQRRRRVFIVGYLGDWERPKQVLFNTNGNSDIEQGPSKPSQVVSNCLEATGFRRSQSGNGFTYVYEDGIRLMTPTEAERLQGFADYYTLIEGATDAKRYKAIGNSMAVPVMRWIGQRIDMVHYNHG